MRFMAVRLTLVLVILACCRVEAVELQFQTRKTANFFWMVDQISQWSPKYTDPQYRAYWDEKVGFTGEDLAVLERYAELRRLHAHLKETEVQKEISPWTSLFGRARTLPHERFALAFLESDNLGDAAAFLKFTAEEQKVLEDTMKHMAAKIKDHWVNETAHLSSFSTKAGVLQSVADLSGFFDRFKTFLGITKSIPLTIPVDVLWAPPGFVNPSHMDFHIILPVSADKAVSDDAVLRQMAVAVQEVGGYMLGKAPEQMLASAARLILSECGLVNPDHPEILRDAMLAALGQRLFLKDTFGMEATGSVLVPYDVHTEFPFAVDELARRLAPKLSEHMNTANAFFPTFVEAAVVAQKELFPPRPEYFARAGVLLADDAARQVFAGLFHDVERRVFQMEETAAFVSAVESVPGCTAFLVLTPEQDGKLWEVLKGLGVTKQLSTLFNKVKKSNFIQVLTTKTNTIYVVRGLDADGLRKALVRLYTMREVPAETVLVE